MESEEIQNLYQDLEIVFGSWNYKMECIAREENTFLIRVKKDAN